MKRILLFTIIIVSGFSHLQSQSTCTEYLTNAQRSFDDGILDDIPMLLADCMREGFTNEEKTNAYKLLIQTYLFTEQNDKADEVMIQFLSEFPSYSIAVNDPREFIDLYNSYRTKPIYKLDFLASAIMSVPFKLFTPSVADRNNDLKEYSPGIGLQLEARYMNTLKGDFNYSAGLSFCIARMGYYDEPFAYAPVEATYKSMTVGVPLALIYDYKMMGLNFYAKAGIEPTYLLSYKVDITRARRGGGDPYTSGGSGVNLINSHNRIDVRPFLGVGAKINLGRDQLHIALGYKFGVINQSPKENRFMDPDFTSKFYTVEDQMLTNNACISISYYRPIYKPMKIR